MCTKDINVNKSERAIIVTLILDLFNEKPSISVTVWPRQVVCWNSELKVGGEGLKVQFVFENGCARSFRMNKADKWAGSR